MIPRFVNTAADNADLAENLSAAAHLIHGSGEGYFTARHDVGKLPTGWNTAQAGDSFCAKPGNRTVGVAGFVQAS